MGLRGHTSSSPAAPQLLSNKSMLSCQLFSTNNRGSLTPPPTNNQSSTTRPINNCKRQVNNNRQQSITTVNNVWSITRFPLFVATTPTFVTKLARQQ
jgi:hypothetical protein